MSTLVSTEQFTGWADALRGQSLEGINDRNGNPIDGPVLIKGIELGEHPMDAKIITILPNKKRAVRKLTEFMHHNYFSREELGVDLQPKSVAELAGGWPDEINGILDQLVQGDVPADKAFEALEDTETFMNWKGSLRGLELAGVRKGDGSVIDDTLKVKNVRKNSGGRPTIYMKRPDGRRVSMSLERFLKQNLPAERANDGAEGYAKAA